MASPNAKWQNFVAMLVFGIKFPTNKREIMTHATSLKDVDEPCSRVLTAWVELDQRVTDTAVRQWRTRLRACVKGGHFEHRLSQ